MTAAVLPVCDSPEVVFDELMEELRYALTNRPRDLQKAIGPSEVGEPCSRALIAKLAGLPEADEGVNWRADVGTAVHAMFERIISRSVLQAGPSPRFLLEQRVTVGMVAGQPLAGSCDLFDTASGCVWDWKTKSKTQMAKHRRNGPGRKYEVQFQCYGLGMELAGHRVTSVGAIYLPRDGEWGDVFYQAIPYDPQIAIDALARANQLHALASLLGAEQAMALYPPCDDEWCRRCKDPNALAARPGHPGPSRTPGLLATSTRELFAAK